LALEIIIFGAGGQALVKEVKEGKRLFLKLRSKRGKKKKVRPDQKN